MNRNRPSQYPMYGKEGRRFIEWDLPISIPFRAPVAKFRIRFSLGTCCTRRRSREGEKVPPRYLVRPGRRDLLPEKSLDLRSVGSRVNPEQSHSPSSGIDSSLKCQPMS